MLQGTAAASPPRFLSVVKFANSRVQLTSTIMTSKIEVVFLLGKKFWYLFLNPKTKMLTKIKMDQIVLILNPKFVCFVTLTYITFS
jgi:hypothetical protein